MTKEEGRRGGRGWESSSRHYACRGQDESWALVLLAASANIFLSTAIVHTTLVGALCFLSRSIVTSDKKVKEGGVEAREAEGRRGTRRHH